MADRDTTDAEDRDLGGEHPTDHADRPASPLDGETPGSQGEIESGSEGDFGKDRPPADGERLDSSTGQAGDAA
jgi:hypothetical protein